MASVETVVFDPSAPKTFKYSDNFVNGDEGYVYDALKCDSSLTYTELVSVELFDIVTSFNIPLEAHQQIVNLTNTESLSVVSSETVTSRYTITSKAHQQIVNLVNAMISEKEKINQRRVKILDANEVETLLEQKTTVKAKEYDMCPNSCQLYNVAEDEDKCAICGHGRFLESPDSSLAIPAATWK